MADTFSFEDAQKPLPTAAKQAAPATFSFEEAATPVKPGLLDDIGNAVRATGEKVGAAALKGAQALTDIFPSLKDEGLAAPASPQDTRSIDQLSADLNRDAAKHAPQTIPGQVAGALAYAPLGAAAPLVMGGAEGVARKQALLDQGVDESTANKAGLAEGALQGTIGALPLGNFVTGAGRGVLAKSVASSVGKAAAAGAGQSVASDAATQAYLEGNGYDEQAKNFAPSVEKAAEGALFMGAFHSGMQGAHVVAGKAANAVAGRLAPQEVPIPDAASGATVADQLRAIRPLDEQPAPAPVPRADLQVAKDATVAQAKAADPVASADAVLNAPTLDDAMKAADAIINAPLPGLESITKEADVRSTIEAAEKEAQPQPRAQAAQQPATEPAAPDAAAAALADTTGEPHDPALAAALHAVDGVGRGAGDNRAVGTGTGGIADPAGRIDGAERVDPGLAAGVAGRGESGVPVADRPVDAKPPLGGPRNRLTPFSHPDLTDSEVRTELAHMATEAGWEQVGGKILRADGTDQTSDVTGRTSWIPKQPWYQMMPERLNEQATMQAVDKALNGKPMTAKEKRVVANMLDFAKASLEEQHKWRNQAYDETGAADHHQYESDASHADRIAALDSDIPLDAHDARLIRADHLTDEDIDAIFRTQPASRSLSENADAGNAGPRGAGTDAPETAGRAPFSLESETPDQVRAREHEAEQASAAQRRATAVADASERAAMESKDVRQRGSAAAENFQLGEDPHDALAGQTPLFDRATREQAKNAALNRAVDVALRRANGLATEPMARTSAVLKLRQAFNRLESSKEEPEIAHERFRNTVESLLTRLEEKTVAKQTARDVAERQRGADFLREKLLMAKRRGDISPETADMADWFIRQNPALVDELGLSVKSFKGDGNAPAGSYNPLARVMTLFKGAANDTTAVHEILHHFERLMPKDMQAAIRAEYLGRIGKLLEAKDTPQATKDYLRAALEGYASGDAKAMQRAQELLTKAPEDAYQYFNPSEFWAVNATRLLERRYGAQDSVWVRIGDWLRNAVEHVKGALGLASDAPVLRALDRVMAGDSGAMPKDAKMLSEGRDFNADTRTIEVDGERRPIENSKGQPLADSFEKQQAFYRWFGDSKVVDEQGRPRVLYHGTTSDFDAFSADKTGAAWDAGKLGKGFYFSTDPRLASSYATMSKAKGHDDAPHVMPVFASIKNPLEIGPLDWRNGENLWGKLRDFSEQAGIKEDPVSDQSSNQPNPAWSGPFRAALERFGYDGVVLKFSDGHQEVVAFHPEQIKSVNNRGEFAPDDANILYDRTKPPADTEAVDAERDGEEATRPEVTAADQSALSKLVGVPKEMLHSAASSVRQMVIPITDGSMHAMAWAKDFASRNRKAEAQWRAFDRVLEKNYTKDQLEKMWLAADEENDLRREGITDDERGLNRLDPGERDTVELLNKYGQSLWDKAKAAGLVEGDGVAYWTPRVAARIHADGTVENLRGASPGEPSKDARNLRTSASSIKSRQHETTAESEAALKAKFGDDAGYIKNIRVMPRAMAELERAISGRTLVNQIKAHGQVLGQDLFSDTGDKNFVLIDHPALKRWQPKIDWFPADMGKLAEKGLEVKKDGVYRDGEQLASYRIKDGEVQQRRAVLDETGKPVMTSSPLYVRKDFAGPLKAVFTTEPNKVYQALMRLKGGITSLIMISPLTHNMVIWGKAFPTMATTMGWKNNLLNTATLGLRPYFVGHAVRADHAMMNDLIEHGLVPVSGRGMNPDLPAIAHGIEPGNSLLAKGLGKVGDLAGKNVGDKLRSGVDAAGHFWHETLLWDRIADMQAGMAAMMRQSLLDKGLDQQTASYLATHFANRYAGMIPREALSNGMHMLGNLALFSKSFTLTNLGAYRDVIGGLPKEVQAQVKLRAIEVQRALGKNEAEAERIAGKTLSAAQKAARQKAVTVLTLEIAAMATVNSLVQSAMQGQGWQDIKDGFKERLDKLGVKIKDDPLAVLGHPLEALGSLSETSNNPHGKEDRVRIGEDEAGNAYYLRLPVGKVGEELKAYASPLSTGLTLLHNKLSTFVRPFADLTQNEDFQGRRIVNPDDPAIKQVAKFAGYWVKSQLPVDDAVALKHLATGDADRMDKAKLMGTATGLTVGKETGGDAVAELRYQNREQQAKLHDVLPDVREAVRRGDTDAAYDLLEQAGQTPREIHNLLRQIEQPDRISKSALKKFNAHADDEARDKLDRLRK